MRKSFTIIALAALVMLAGCKKNEQQPSGTKLSAGIEQHKSDSKTSLNPDDLKISWTAGDQLYVNNGSESAQFTLTSGADTPNGEFATTGDYTFANENNVAVYPYNQVSNLEGTTVTMTLLAEQNATVGTFGNGANPMLGVFNDPENIQLTSLCGALCLQLTGEASITAIEIEAASSGVKLNGTFTVADYTATTPALTYSEGGSNSIRLNCTATLTADAQKFFVVLPAGTLNGFTMKVYNGDNVIFTKSTANAITFQANYVETMDVVTVAPAAAIPEGALPGVFTVDNAGKKVYFSQANLMFSNGTWSFHENQYDCCFSSNGNVDGSYTSTGTFDYFAWGTSGYNHGASCYQPWSNVNTYWCYYVYGNYIYNLFDETGKADWGYNAISNGGNTENYGWRTLTGEEWNYVFTGRTGPTINSVDNVRFIHATVNGRKGIILFPDFYTHPSELADHQPVGSGANTTYSATEFALMHADGAVFLPKVGSIHAQQAGNSVISGFNNNGHYWSSSSSGESYAKEWLFNGWSAYSTDLQREYRCCVRLVYDVQ